MSEYTVEKVLLKPSRYIPPPLPDILDVYLTRNYWRQLRGYPDPAFSGSNFEDLVPPDLTGPGDIPTWDGGGWVPIPRGDPGQVISSPCHVYVELHKTNHLPFNVDMDCRYNVKISADSNWFNGPYGAAFQSGDQIIDVPAGATNTYRIEFTGRVYQATGAGSGGATDVVLSIQRWVGNYREGTGPGWESLVSTSFFLANDEISGEKNLATGNVVLNEFEAIRVLADSDTAVGFAGSTQTQVLKVLCATS